MPSTKKTVPAKGLGLHLGLNAVSAAHYGGWSGELNACENDANDMAALAKGQGMKPTVLLTKKCTRANFLAAMRSAAKALVKGDFFFLTYSGHGGQVPDVTGEEADKKDETWCLYDGQLIDDELYLELGRFAAGVRIVVLSDSCHSGTVTREGPPDTSAAPADARSKMMPLDIGRRTYGQHQAFYDKLQKDVVAQSAKLGAVDPDAALAAIAHTATSGRITTIASVFKPSVVLISGCQDNQTSMDGPHNGAFTGRLLKVWNHAAYKGNYPHFHATIRAGMPASQSPNLFTLGPVATLLAQQPFKL
ncbi:Caspase domain-containing protein [Burkholderiales bacterium JOSHI_001]|nr:Caspase domain-containing protein [Burkholderiales bacterium JOSHI_001]